MAWSLGTWHPGHFSLRGVISQAIVLLGDNLILPLADAWRQQGFDHVHHRASFLELLHHGKLAGSCFLHHAHSLSLLSIHSLAALSSPGVAGNMVCLLQFLKALPQHQNLRLEPRVLGSDASNRIFTHVTGPDLLGPIGAACAPGPRAILQLVIQGGSAASARSHLVGGQGAGCSLAMEALAKLSTEPRQGVLLPLGRFPG
mmetsp:Transcript_52892/g.114354  ORF Transcript_52892/g.114354 Transcript_52892/m.114354 type:complete len:201 (+) Transcript_52892:318-920(+)